MNDKQKKDMFLTLKRLLHKDFMGELFKVIFAHKYKKNNFLGFELMFYSKKLAKEIHVKHCFFNRQGGKSKGIYKSLNCGRGSSDKKKYINKNLIIACKKSVNHIKN